MTKFKKFLASLLSCCMALVLVFAAGCTEPDSSSSSSSSSSTTSSQSETSNTSTGDTSSETTNTGADNTGSENTGTENTGTENTGSDNTGTDNTGTDNTGTDNTGTDNTGTDNTGTDNTGSGSSGTENDPEGTDDNDYTLTSTTVYFVGDSTVCEFSDSYYLPRYGYGTQFGNYVDSNYVTIKNLALSGRSSRSYILEDNYKTLTANITKGDYLIIGFGHNDEKEETSTDKRYTAPTLNAENTEGSFQYYLYNYYISVAETVGATPILCTPIVRYNSSNDYSGSSGHVTSNGDYAACIRDLATRLNITCVDLTTITADIYENLQTEAQWFHAHTSAKKSDDESAREIGVKNSTDTVNVVPTGMDNTHLNMYGAKMVAYNIATALQSARKDCNLGYYVLDAITEPTKKADLEAAYNADYKYVNYDAFTSSDASTLWSLSSSGWYGTVFGDAGTEAKNFTSYYTITDDSTAGTITVGSTATDKGKITSTEGIAMAFMQLDYNQNFEMTVTATVTTAGASTTADTTATAQSGFGLMLRDDIYIDSYDKSILSNYIAAGMYASSSATNIIYSRVESTLTNSGNKVSSVYKVGDTATLTIVRQGQTFTCTVVYGGQTYSYDKYEDFDLVAVDGSYIYLGLYATRGTVVKYSNITYTATGTAVEA